MSASRVRCPAVSARLDEMFADLPATLTVQQVADLLGMHNKGVYRWIREGIIPAYKLGASWFIVRDDLKDALAQGSNLTRRVAEQEAGTEPKED